VVADASTDLIVSSSKLEENGATSAINFGGDQLTLTDSAITLVSDSFGVNFHGRMLNLTGVTVTGGNYGIYQLQGSSRTRGTTIRDYKFIGFYMAQGDLDLGTSTEPGNNVFSSAATGPTVFGLYLDAVTHGATCSDTSFNGVVPPANTIVAGDDPFAQPGQYFINSGSAMSFSVL
jgi:hypothetical protein